jgi:hypothetical protein
MSSSIDAAVSDVLSSKRLKLVHPGDGKLTQLYATPSDSTSVLAETITHRGQYRVSSNSLALGSQSQFNLSTSSIIDNVCLSFAYPIPANCLFAHEGWGFDLIESIEITYSNSLMQNMVIRGEILKEYAKLCCCSKDEREQMLAVAGPIFYDYADGAGLPPRACVVPLSFLNFTTAGKRGSWPMDASVLAGPIQIAINWVSVVKAAKIFNNETGFGGGDLSPNLVAPEITCTTITLQRASFGVKDAMMRDRSLVYSIPSRYLSVVNETRANLTAVTDKLTINLNSAPAGMLEGLLIYAAPHDTGEDMDDWVTGGILKRSFSGGLRVSTVRLQFGSQDLIRYKNRQEMLAFNRHTFGDTLTYDTACSTPNFPNSATNPGLIKIEQDIIFLPLVENGKGVFNGHVNEHVPSYGGSQLQLEISFEDITGQLQGCEGPYSGAFQDAGVKVEATVIDIQVCYIISALVEVSQGTVDLQL